MPQRKKTVRVLAALAALMLVSYAAAVTAYAAVVRPHALELPSSVVSQSEDSTALQLTLCTGQGLADTPFAVENMLPGDSVSKIYCVRAFHKEPISLGFTVKNLRTMESAAGSGLLKDVLCLRVERIASSDSAGTTDVLYDGTVDSLLNRQKKILLPPKAENSTDTYYQITAYLPATAGNEYQNAALLVDFQWYAELEPDKETPDGTAGGTAGGLTAPTVGGIPLPAPAKLPGVPQTGDPLPYALLWAVCLTALAVLLLLWVRRPRMAAGPVQEPLPDAAELAELPKEAPAKKRHFLLGLLLLGGLLALGAAALVTAQLTVKDNKFVTGAVKIELTATPDGVLDARMEPGKTWQQTVTIKNVGTASAWCRLYLSGIEGDLADYVTFTVCTEDGKTLYTAAASAFGRSMAYALPEALPPEASESYLVQIRMPTYIGNEAQDQVLRYQYSADATQQKNNPDRHF